MISVGYHKKVYSKNIHTLSLPVQKSPSELKRKRGVEEEEEEEEEK